MESLRIETGQKISADLRDVAITTDLIYHHLPRFQISPWQLLSDQPGVPLKPGTVLFAKERNCDRGNFTSDVLAYLLTNNL